MLLLYLFKCIYSAICITNGLYLKDSGGNNVYDLSVQYNTTYYANQILACTVPASLPVGYTVPSNFVGYPTTSRTPYIEILSGLNFWYIFRVFCW